MPGGESNPQGAKYRRISSPNTFFFITVIPCVYKANEIVDRVEGEARQEIAVSDISRQLAVRQIGCLRQIGGAANVSPVRCAASSKVSPSGDPPQVLTIPVFSYGLTSPGGPRFSPLAGVTP